MPDLYIKSVEYGETRADTTNIELELRIRPDDDEVTIAGKSIAPGHRWMPDLRVPFSQSITVRVKERDVGSDDLIGTITLGSSLVHKQVATLVGTTSPTGDDTVYIWYEVLPAHEDRVAFHRPTTFSLRACMGRIGAGVLGPQSHRELVSAAHQVGVDVDPVLYRCAQVISVKEVISRHAAQDRGRTDGSLKQWLVQHCNPWGDESTITPGDSPQSAANTQVQLGAGNWLPVKDEVSRFVAGLQGNTKRATTDNPFAHETWDWNWDLILDPACLYLQTYTTPSYSSVQLPSGNVHPLLHCEWEWGSMPVQFRPFWGEYVTAWGRHVFDRGHAPVDCEFHPPHTIAREHTTATSFDQNGPLVPANETTIGMGACGGFPRWVPERWLSETGNDHQPLGDDQVEHPRCYFTDLRKHAITLRLFPPTPRPSPTAVLRVKVSAAEIILKNDWDGVESFLEMCTHDAGRGSIPDDVARLGFQHWDNGNPQSAAIVEQPTFVVQNGFADVTVNLSGINQFVAGYKATVHCGWSERGPHQIQQIDVEFKELRSGREALAAWELLYGVNGNWAAFWRRISVQTDLNASFRVFTVDEMPLVLRDTGEASQRLSIVARGPDHFGSIARLPNVQVIQSAGDDDLLLDAQAGEDKDIWRIHLTRQQL